MSTLHDLRYNTKKNPQAYRKEVEAQYAHFKSALNLLKIQPLSSENGKEKKRELPQLVDFLAHLAVYFKKLLKPFPVELIDLLENHSEKVPPLLRLACVKALILMRNKDFIAPLSIFPLFFTLFRVQDKPLRKLVFSHIVQDISRMNMKASNMKVNRAVQNYMLGTLRDSNTTTVKKSLSIMMELFRRGVWNDARTVNIVTTCCFSSHSAVIRNALRFFMGDVKNVLLEQEEADRDLKKQIKCNTKRVAKRLDKIMKQQERLDARKENKELGMDDGNDYKAIKYINDPHTFAQKLFSSLRKSREAFDLRVEQLRVLSRVMAYHSVTINNFYPFLQKYLRHHQTSVTRILTSIAQATHKLTPPEDLVPTIRHIADSFVSDKSNVEAMAVGINAITAICRRQPLVMDEDLLGDLAQYQKHKDRGVWTAARALIQLYRMENPQLLRKKDRGRFTDENKQPEDFGTEKIDTNVKGIELLEELEGAPINRILTTEDVLTIKRLRIQRIMDKHKVYDEDLVGLEEEKDIDANLVEEGDIISKTTIRKERKAAREEERKNRQGTKLAWDFHAKQKGGTGTNQEMARNKPFEMVQKARNVRTKSKRSLRKKQSTGKKHKMTMAQEGKSRKRRRR